MGSIELTRCSGRIWNEEFWKIGVLFNEKAVEAHTLIAICIRTKESYRTEALRETRVRFRLTHLRSGRSLPVHIRGLSIRIGQCMQQRRT